jgi:TRAP-type mannitol/chloroaromatic compound transport system permease small subunit
LKALLKLSAFIDAVNEMIGKLVMWLILAAVLISAGNAIVRKAFNIGSNSFLEIQWYLFSAVFMLGVGYVMLRNQHVRIDFISSRLSDAHQRDHRCHRHRGLHHSAVDHHDRPGLAACSSGPTPRVR